MASGNLLRVESSFERTGRSPPLSADFWSDFEGGYIAPFCCIPRSHRTASFLYLRSPLELMRIAGSLPRLPQRLMVSGDTRKIFATSRTVNSSGHSSPKDIEPPVHWARGYIIIIRNSTPAVKPCQEGSKECSENDMVKYSDDA